MRKGIVIAVIVFSLIIPVVTISCDTTQLPEGEAVIGPDGGVVEVTDPESPLFGTRIEIPEGALDEPKLIVIMQGDPPSELPHGCTLAGIPLEVGPDDIQLAIECTITITYSDSDDDGFEDNSGIDEDYLMVYHYWPEDGTFWHMETLAGDVSRNTLEFTTNHFSTFLLWSSTVEPTVNWLIDWTPLNNPADRPVFEDAIRDAIDVWADELTGAVEFMDRSSEYPENPSLSDILQFRNDYEDDTNSSLLFTFLPVVGSDAMSLADTVILDDPELRNESHIYRVAATAHELGHYLGLPHPFWVPWASDDFPVLMWAVSESATMADDDPNRLLSLHDKYRIREKYGLGVDLLPKIERLKPVGTSSSGRIESHLFWAYYFDPNPENTWKSLRITFDTGKSDVLWQATKQVEDRESLCYEKYEFDLDFSEGEEILGTTLSITSLDDDLQPGNTLNYIIDESVVDADGDTIWWDVDNCPCLYNPDQTDSDANGIGDVCDADYEDLVDGVSEVTSPGVPGPVQAEEPNNWVPIVAGDENAACGGDTSGPKTFVMARTYEDGRVVIMGHDGLIEALDQLDNEQLMLNIISWLDTNDGKRVVFSTGHDEWVTASDLDPLKTELESRDYSFEAAPYPISSSFLADVDVIIFGNASGTISSSEIDAVESFAANGGGLLLIGLGWSWGHYHPEPIEEYPMMQLALPYGVRWLECYLWDVYYDQTPIFNVFYPDIPRC